ncbi:MAG: haloacid dehalogenase, partial [Steroidobacteraceae bacterium]
MNALYVDLQWLPRPPQDFAERLKALSNPGEPAGGQIQSLALHALNLNQLTKLARAIGKLKEVNNSLEPLSPFRLAVLSNSTIDLIVPALVASAARHGVALEV